MYKISKRFNLILILSISISVVLTSIIITGLLIFRSEQENHKKNLMQLRSLTDNIEGFFTNAYNLNYQLSINPEVIENVVKSEDDWIFRQKNYGTDFSFLYEMAGNYEWVELFFVQDINGLQTGRSTGPLGDRSSRWWFQKMKVDSTPFISKSYYSMTGNIPVASVFHPVKNNGEVIGIIGTDINFTILQNKISSYLYSDTMSAILIDSTGTVVAHHDPEPVEKLYNLINKTKQIIELDKNGRTVVDDSGHHLTKVVSADISSSLQEAAKGIERGEEGCIKKVKVYGKLSSVYFSSVKYPGAKMGDYYGVILIHDHTKLIRFVTILLIFISTMIVLGTFLLYILFHKIFDIRILKPLKTLISAMQQNSITDFKKVEMNTKDEFELLASTYNDLRADLAETHLDLQEKMAELCLSEEGYRTFAAISLDMAGLKKKQELLKKIVRKGMDLCNADGGTLYLYNSELKQLEFEVLMNDSLDIKKLKDELGENFFPPVPLEHGGVKNISNVSAFCAISERLVNIEDVYEHKELDFSGVKRYDSQNNYRSKSMLVVPLKNLEGDIVGVLQLINSKDRKSGKVDKFTEHCENIAQILATMGAVTLTNIELHNNHEEFLYSFMRSIASAIDEKSCFTSGHIERVTDLSVLVARAVNESKAGVFKDVNFSEEEVEEISMAAWMHDVGKISIPEAVLNKSTKLMLVKDRYELIETRAELISALYENILLKESSAFLKDNKLDEMVQMKREIDEGLKLIKQSNEAHHSLEQSDIDRLVEFSKLSVKEDDIEINLLTPEELHYLTIAKGTLDKDERKVIEGHVNVARKILGKLHFPDHLSQVATFVYQHHERMDGSGYDAGLSGRDLPLQSRIIAISDVLEALTANDRPYRKPLSHNEALEIIEKMANDGLVDTDLLTLIKETNLLELYYDKVKD